MENMISIPENRYIELLEIEKKYNPDARIYYAGNGGTVFEISPDGSITAEKL